MEYGDASGTGFLDVRNRSWSTEVLRAMDGERDLIDLLPNLIEPQTPAGTISATVADELGLARDLIVSSGGGDNMMGAVGTGAVCNGAVTVSLGTSGTLYGFADTPVVPKATEFAAFCSSTGGWLPLVCTMNCTSSSELVRELLGIGLDLFEHLLAESEPGAGGIVSLPFFDGERTPNLPNGRASLMGMTECGHRVERNQSHRWRLEESSVAADRCGRFRRQRRRPNARRIGRLRRRPPGPLVSREHRFIKGEYRGSSRRARPLRRR
jgi:xylulokinase